MKLNNHLKFQLASNNTQDRVLLTLRQQASQNLRSYYNMTLCQLNNHYKQLSTVYRWYLDHLKIDHTIHRWIVVFYVNIPVVSVIFLFLKPETFIYLCLLKQVNLHYIHFFACGWVVGVYYTISPIPCVICHLEGPEKSNRVNLQLQLFKNIRHF